MNTSPRHAVSMPWGSSAPSHSHAYLAGKVVRWLRSANARRVLDLGCGNGALTMHLARQGFDMIGIDASESGIAIASAQAGPNAQFRHVWMDESLPADLHGAFDAVIAVEVIEHLMRPSVLCVRAREALRPAGLLTITTPYHGYVKNLALAVTDGFDRHWHPLRDGGHVKFFSRATLTTLLCDQGFDVTAVAYGGRIRPVAKSILMQARPRRL